MTVDQHTQKLTADSDESEVAMAPLALAEYVKNGTTTPLMKARAKAKRADQRRRERRAR